MFGGVGTILVVVVMRFLVMRQWAVGIGLSVRRRLMLPAIALLIGFLGLHEAAAAIVVSPLGLLLGAAVVITVAAGAVRAGTVVSSLVPETELYPGGVRLRARTITLVADVGAVVLAAAIVLPPIGSVAGLHPAAGAWIVAVALGDVAAAGLLLLRRRPTLAGVHDAHGAHEAR